MTFWAARFSPSLVDVAGVARARLAETDDRIGLVQFAGTGVKLRRLDVVNRFDEMHQADIVAGPEIAVPTGIDDLAIDLVGLPADVEGERLGPCRPRGPP